MSLSSRGNLKNCVAEYNGTYGFGFSGNTLVKLEDCVAKFNGYGVILSTLCNATFIGSGEFSNNSQHGIHVIVKSVVVFKHSDYTGEIRNNGGYGLSIMWDACSIYHSQNSFSGNSLGDVYTAQGGHTY